MSPKADIIFYSKLCYRNNFLSAFDGNLSVRTKKNYILITASNTSKGKLTEKNIIKADFKGNKIQGKGQVSSEFKLHKYIYEKREDVNAVVHTHPVYATAFASAGIALDKPVYPEVYLMFGKIPLAKYAAPSTDEVPQSISEFVKDYDAILLANHGLVTYGRTIEEAYFKTEKVEHIAQISFFARMLGGEKILTNTQVNKLEPIKEKIKTKKNRKS
jgi:L-fuculose-phosphate aldolase